MGIDSFGIIYIDGTVVKLMVATDTISYREILLRCRSAFQLVVEAANRPLLLATEITKKVDGLEAPKLPSPGTPKPLNKAIGGDRNGTAG